MSEYDDNAVDMASENSLPLGIGASAFGSENGDDEEYFIQERTLPFALGLAAPVGQRLDRPESPAPSYLSMHSGFGSNSNEIQPCGTEVHLIRQHSSTSSSICSDSDDDMDQGDPEERSKKSSKVDAVKGQHSVKPELQKDENRHPALTVEFSFKTLTSCLKKLKENELKRFMKLLWERYPECFVEPLDGFDIVDLVDKMLELCDVDASLKITMVLLRDMGLKNLSEHLQGLCKRNEVRYELKKTLRRKYSVTYEGFGLQGQPVEFESVYTDLYLTDGNNAGVNIEHEFRPKIEELAEISKVKRQPLSYNDILDPKANTSRHIRSIIIKGSPGSGKSFAVQRFILNWADGKLHPEIFFLLPLQFSELNQMLEGEYTLMTLVNTLYPEMNEIETLEYEDCQVTFICDGLDESQISFNFRRTMYWCDPNRPTTVQVLITNLIRGHLLHHANVCVITRPGALDVIPLEYVHQLLEVRGFNNEQREVYFRKTIHNQELAEKIIAHLQSSKSLYIMCHLPLFCCIASKVLQQQFQLSTSSEMPKTLTSLYTNFLHLHTKICCQKLQNNLAGNPKGLSAEQMLIKLAKMAYNMLEKNVFQIETEHWDEVELDPHPAVVFSGLCSEHYREKFVMYTEKVTSFTHPTIQEYLAAVHVLFCFKKDGKNVLEASKFKVMKVSLTELLKSAVDKALTFKSSNFDLFLRFVLGLSMEANQELLKNLLQIPVSSSQSAREETVRYIKKKIKENQYPEKNLNLMLCIDELHTQF